MRREPRPADRHLDTDRRERARRRRCRRRSTRRHLRRGGRGTRCRPGNRSRYRVRTDRRADAGNDPTRHSSDARVAPPRADDRDDRSRSRHRILPADAAARHAALGRLPVRHRHHRRTRPRGVVAHRDAVVGDRRATHGSRTCPGTPTRVRRDARLDHLHLHRQDRHAHPEPDAHRRGVDAEGQSAARRRGLRARRGDRAARRRPRGTREERCARGTRVFARARRARR